MTIVVLSIALCVSAIYILLLSGKEDRFLQYWAFSWIAYSFSLLCVFLFINREQLYLLGIRGLFDLINIFCLMLSAFAFSQVKIPNFMKWAVIVVAAWGIAGILIGLDALIIFIPISVFGGICTIIIIWLVMKHWPRDVARRGFAAVLFFVWGFGKGIGALLESMYEIPISVFFLEVLFSNLLNYAIIIIFMQRSVELLTRSEKKFRVIADNASDVVFLYELKAPRRYVYITPSVEDITGYSPEQFLKDHDFMSSLVSPDDKDSFNQLFRPESYEYNNEDDSHTSSLVFSLTHKNNTPIWAEIKTTLIEEEEEQGIAIVGIMHDISLLKGAEQEMIVSKQSRDKLLSYISHELRIPMTAIIGYIEALRDGVIEGKEDRTEALDVIINKAKTLNHLIDDLFSLSQFESHQVSMNLTIADLVELSDYLAKVHEEKGPHAEIEVISRIERSKLKGKYSVVDRERITQVVSNLVINAKKFSSAGGIVKLTFGLDKDSENYTISVSDKGTGISDKDLPYIFERFFSRGSGRKGGESSAGLGLTLTKEIVEAHKGTISVESKEDKGSIFTVSLPLYFENQ